MYCTLGGRVAFTGCPFVFGMCLPLEGGFGCGPPIALNLSFLQP